MVEFQSTLSQSFEDRADMAWFKSLFSSLVGCRDVPDIRYYPVSARNQVSDWIRYPVSGTKQYLV